MAPSRKPTPCGTEMGSFGEWRMAKLANRRFVQLEAERERADILEDALARLRFEAFASPEARRVLIENALQAAERAKQEILNTLTE